MPVFAFTAARTCCLVEALHDAEPDEGGPQGRGERIGGARPHGHRVLAVEP